MHSIFRISMVGCFILTKRKTLKLTVSNDQVIPHRDNSIKYPGLHVFFNGLVFQGVDLMSTINLYFQ